MSTETKTAALNAEILADCEAVIERVRSGKPLDPEVARRVRERAAQVTGHVLPPLEMEFRSGWVSIT